MIHPINIPDDLLTANPKRPQFIEPKNRPKIIYSKEGRRFHQDGKPLSPKSPTGLWNDFFLRSFVRRIACEHQADAAERASIDTLIDVVDLQPFGSEPHLDVNLNIVNSHSLEKEVGDMKLEEEAETPKQLQPKNPVFSLVTDRAEVYTGSDDDLSTDEEENSLNASATLGSGACLPRKLSRQVSAKVKPSTIKPLLTPCCSSGLSDNRCKGATASLKEFARFDFSHSNIFSNDLPNQSDPDDTSAVDIVKSSKISEQNPRKKSLLLLPNSLGSRIWTSVDKTCISTSKKLTPTISLPLDMNRQQRPAELLFRILSVATCRKKKLYIALEIHNSMDKELRFQIVEHVHEAMGEKIDGIVQNTKEKTVTLKKNENTKVEILLDITDTIQKLFQHPDKYLVITLHGRIL